jgi:hypothetical protein
MEAITRKKEVDEVKVLNKSFGNTTPTLAAGVWSVTGDQDPEILTQSAQFVTWYQSTYFDLAGMTIEEKTLFFKAVQTQRGFTPEFVAGAVGDSLMEQVVLTTSPIPSTRLLAAFVNPVGTLDFSEVVYCESRVYSKTLDEGTLSFPMLVHNNVLSGARASASDRIYCYRIMSLSAAVSGAGVTSATVTPVMMVIGADAKEEPTYQYLMRLKRSYELQNEPDVD